MWEGNKKKNGRAHTPLTLWNTFVSVQLHKPGDPPVLKWGALPQQHILAFSSLKVRLLDT